MHHGSRLDSHFSRDLLVAKTSREMLDNAAFLIRQPVVLVPARRRRKPGSPGRNDSNCLDDV
jgi:hypothetical protein